MVTTRPLAIATHTDYIHGYSTDCIFAFTYTVSTLTLRSCLKMIFRISYNCKSGRWERRPRRMPRLASPPTARWETWIFVFRQLIRIASIVTPQITSVVTWIKPRGVLPRKAQRALIWVTIGEAGSKARCMYRLNYAPGFRLKSAPLVSVQM